jgi:hypothetical protein
MYNYFIQPKREGSEVDEDDLDEPSNAELEQELSKIVPRSHVFPTASKKSPETSSDETVLLVSRI